MTKADLGVREQSPQMPQANNSKNDARDAEPRSLRVHKDIIATTGPNCLVNRDTQPLTPVRPRKADA
jgi:hypothetical protein